jgi:hypothetical protein
MAAHLVETSEEDSLMAVAAYIGELMDEGQVRRRPCCLRWGPRAAPRPPPRSPLRR